MFAEKNRLNWQDVPDQITQKNEFGPSYQLYFKHSPRCGVSRMALKNFELEFKANEHVSCVLVDVLAQRNFSNQLAQFSGITHESPQVLLFKNNDLIYHDSHYAISAETINSLIHEQN